MDWAPVVHVGASSGRQLGSLSIVDESTVEWYKLGTIFRRFSMESPVQKVFFTSFAHAQDPKEMWIVIVCKDRLLYSYSTMSGRHHVTGLTFTPVTILACPEQGVLFTSVRSADHFQALHLLQGPEELPGSVGPSSVCAPLSKAERVIFFGEHYAIVWNPEKSLVRAYTVRFIHHRNLPRPAHIQTPLSAGSGISSSGSAISSSTSSLPVESQSKVAVIQLVREWRQTEVGRVFGQTQDISTGKLRIVACHDPGQDMLYVFCDGELVRHSEVTHVCPISGPLGFPAVAISSKDKLQLAFLLFPQSPPLGIPIPKQYSDLVITALESETRSNWIDVHFKSGGSCRLLLATEFTALVGACIGIVKEVAGALEATFWLLGLLAQRSHTSDDWVAFQATMDALTPEMDSAQVLQIVMCLHLLREEYTLVAGSNESLRALSRLLHRYVASWGPAWTEYYEAYTSHESFDVIRTVDSPPNIYTALLSTMQAQGGRSEYPEIVYQSTAYPKSRALLEFFRLLSVETPITEMQLYLEQHFSGPRLAELAPVMKICVLEVAEYLDLTLDALSHQDESQRVKKGSASFKQRHAVPKLKHSEPISESYAIAQALFPLDRRLDEAERLLQTKGPQQCVFGVFFDPENLSDHEIAHLQMEWGRALSERALASAFGRGALELGSRLPVFWEQLDVPAIDFSGECVHTGLSIPPLYRSLEQVSMQAPWGAFAHGVALGLSIRPRSPGIDSLWVVTSAKLKSASAELYAGLVFGMGLSGHLAGLEEWQFYESLVSPNSRGTVAALLGVAASKRGSRDSKLTKVLSVHIRTLLPETARLEPLVGPDEERAAIISLGLLYYGQGVRHLTEVLGRELLRTQFNEGGNASLKGPNFHNADETDNASVEESLPNSDEDYSLALGIALGLINSGKANLAHLLPLVTRSHDRTSFSPGIANGALCALLLSYVGSNAKLVASQIQLPFSRRAALYSMPSTVFSKALVHHLIMWDEIGTSKEWVLAQIPSDLKLEEDDGSSEIEGLWYMHALCGVLTALALRNTARNDSSVIGIILEFVESVFYPKYSSLLKSLTKSGHGYDKRASYDTIQAAKNIAQLISTLLLAVAATAAGSGNVRVLQVLRVAYQVSPQVQASERANTELVEGVGLDLLSISEAIGWLFMGSGQWSFRNDPQSVGLLACVSFLPLMGGPGISAESWYHMRFLWVLVSEHRCLRATPNSTEQVQIEIVFKSGRVSTAQLPILLPPLSEIQQVRIADDRYRPFVTTDLASVVTGGLPSVRHSSPQDTLEAHFAKNGNEVAIRNSAMTGTLNSTVQTAMKVMQYIAKYAETPSDIEALRLLLFFAENWPAPESRRILKVSDYEQLKLAIWRKANNYV